MEKLHRFIHQVMLSKMKRWDIDAFRSQMKEENVRKLFKTYGRKLKAIFLHYATLESVNTNEEAFTNTIDLHEFLLMLRQGILLKPEGPISHDEVRQIFNAAQNEMDTHTDKQHKASHTYMDKERLESQKVDDASESEIVYPEFLEAVCALACYRITDPYRTFYDKVHTFVTQEFIPRLYKK